MVLDSSLEEGFSLIRSLFEDYLDPLSRHRSSNTFIQSVTTVTLTRADNIQDQSALITPPPELRVRKDIVPRQADCTQAVQQASQSASQAIQQASQQASQSIQQAQQSASQAASRATQQANQSASDAIRSANSVASQSIDAASRSAASAASVVASISSQLSSIQSSASLAVAQANGQVTSAQGAASAAQSEASKAVLQAGAAVAAATGSAAAAGSSFLAAAAKATQSAQQSVSAIGAQASQQVSAASQAVVASQQAAITATQAALAIVGSIIASALITILIYFLLIRHKKKNSDTKQKAREEKAESPGAREYFNDPKFSSSDQDGSTLAPTKSRETGSSKSQKVLSLFPSRSTTLNKKSSEKQAGSDVKETSVAWNPSKPPKAPTLTSWLKVQDGVSPFGPISLPSDKKVESQPLGGQLKSPLQGLWQPPTAIIKRKASRKSLANNTPPGPKPLEDRVPTLPILALGSKTIISTGPITPLQPQQTQIFTTNLNPFVNPPLNPFSDPPPKSSQNTNRRRTKDSFPTADQYRASTSSSIWTDEPMQSPPSPPLQSPPPRSPFRPKAGAIISPTRGSGMVLPTPKNPVRNTAEWLAAAAELTFSSELKNSLNSKPSSSRQSEIGVAKTTMDKEEELRRNMKKLSVMSGGKGGLPSGPRMGLPSHPGMGRKSQVPEGGFVTGLNRFLGDGERGSGMLSRESSVGTPGKAL